MPTLASSGILQELITRSDIPPPWGLAANYNQQINCYILIFIKRENNRISFVMLAYCYIKLDINHKLLGLNIDRLLSNKINTNVCGFKPLNINITLHTIWVKDLCVI